MAAAAQQIYDEWYEEIFNYSEGKLCGLVDRLVAICNPVCIYAFGSRVMGTARTDSDLDLAIVVDKMDREHPRPPVSQVREGLRMIVDLVVFDRAEFERIRPWYSTIENEVWKHGIVIYDRERQPSTNRQALTAIAGGRSSTHS